MVIKSFNVLSVGKMLGALYAILGLIAGALFSLMAVAGAAAGGAGNQGAGAMLFGVGAIIIVPIFYGIIGFVGGIISAALYNVLANMVGGIEMEIHRDTRAYED